MTIEVEKEMSVPNLDRHAVQGIVLFPEMRHLVHVRRSDEAPVEAVGPRMVGALDAPGELAGRVGAEACTAMAADVVEGVDTPVRRSRDDDAVARHVTEDELAGRSTSSARPAQIHIERKSASSSRSKYAAVGVERRRQRARACGHDVARFDDHVGVGHEVHDTTLACRSRAARQRRVSGVSSAAGI